MENCKCIRAILLSLTVLYLFGCTSRTTVGIEPGTSPYAPHIYPLPKEIVFQQSILAASALEWQVAHTDALSGVIAVEVGTSMMTWGDKVSILVSAVTPTSTRVDVTSGTRGQLVDWGKSRVNIRTFYEKLDALLAQQPSAALNVILQGSNKENPPQVQSGS